MDNIVYAIVKFVLVNMFGIFFRWQRIGLENIPATGGVVIASNHISLVDPPLVGVAIKRKMHFMAKEELFAIPVLGPLIHRLGAFPIRRGLGDRNALRIAIRLLDQGHVVGLFPEGTRSRSGLLQNGQLGVVMIAAKAKVPIIPATVMNTNKIFKRGQWLPRLTVCYGKPIMVDYPDTPDKEFMKHLTDKIMGEIADLQLKIDYQP